MLVSSGSWQDAEGGGVECASLHAGRLPAREAQPLAQAAQACRDIGLADGGFISFLFSWTSTKIAMWAAAARLVEHVFLEKPMPPPTIFPP